MAKIRAAQNKTMRLGLEKSKDPEYLRKLYDEHPDYFNDTRLRLRHIVFAVPLTATAEQKRPGTTTSPVCARRSCRARRRGKRPSN